MNSILSSMYIFWCSVFILPKKIIYEVEKLCKNFFWHGTNEPRKGGIVAWNVVCQQKALGGLGVKHVNIWNQAIQLKHIWELIQEKKILWAFWVIRTKLEKLSF